MPSVMHHTENKGMMGPQYVEDSVREPTEVCAVDVLMDDGIACRILSNPLQGPIQLIAEGEIETR
jgi:hypothetical protein